MSRDNRIQDKVRDGNLLRESTIFIVVNSFGKGGAELSLAVLAAELAKLKHRVFYIALWNELDSYDFDWLRATGVQVCTLSRVRSNYFVRFIEFSRLIKENRPAFIYSAMLNSNIISQVFSLLYSIPHAASIRNNPATYYGKIWYKKLVFSLGMTFQKNIVFISEKAKSEYSKSAYGKLLRHKNLSVLHNPVEADTRITDDFLDRKFKLTKGKLISFVEGDSNVVIELVMASRLVKGKGIMEFLENNRDQLQDSRLRLSIYGSGSLEKVAREYIEREFPLNNVVLMGYERDPYKIFSPAELFIFPSTSEGFGRAPFEAALMGNLILCNEKVSIINEVLDNALTWQDYSIYPHWKSALTNFSQINPHECVKLTKHIRSMLSPETHAFEFEKIAGIISTDGQR